MQIKILKTAEEKNKAYELRKEVFVIEQNVPLTLELDDKDKLKTTFHFGVFIENNLVATARVLNATTKNVHIGRVAVKKEYRKQNIGKILLLEIERVLTIMNTKTLTSNLSAQIQVEDFYKKLGYRRKNNKTYLDAGIEHIDMYKILN